MCPPGNPASNPRRIITVYPALDDIDTYIDESKKALAKYRWAAELPAFEVFGNPKDDMLVLNAAQTSALIAIAQSLRELLTLIGQQPLRTEAADTQVRRSGAGRGGVAEDAGQGPVGGGFDEFACEPV
jgi:hypothetical protein